MSRILSAACLALALGLGSLGHAHAQAGAREEPDPTRLDVERLPPEAIQVTRDLYERGFFVESHFGALGFIGGVGNYAGPGFYVALQLGYEFAPWISFLVSTEASIHQTSAPAPPDTTVFEVVSFLGSVRFNWEVDARSALHLTADVGVELTTSDVLLTYGLSQSDEVGFVAGGRLGYDWHFRNPNGSIGLVAGSRVYPKLEGPRGDIAVGILGSAYLRYVF